MPPRPKLRQATSLTERSSLFSHSFPSFYACYLLKSVQTPASTATYIGSTPSPPRRIRQHNGELTQGAHKTRLRRPWVMQIIVYGFPSKLAALQFEWAWQHAQISRHLRDADGNAMLRRANTVGTNIRNVRLMLSTHPWSTWPLHVKLFTPAAVAGWKSANDHTVIPLPPAFTCVTELEGVDGKSGQVGSGRLGPIKVDDAQFTLAHLAKNTALLATNRRLTCSICNEDVLNYSTDPLKTTLCPTTGCTAVSHILCISNDFLSSQPSDSGMIPRGGHCKSCQTYVLWGDIIRGMYRRSAGGAVPEEDEGDDDGLFLSDIEPDASPASDVPPPKSAKARGKAKAQVVTSPKRRRLAVEQDSSEGEAFDFNVSSSSDGEPPSTLKRRGPRKVPAPTVDAPKSSPRKRANPQIPTSDVDMPDTPPKKRAKSTARTPVLADKQSKRGGAKPSPKKYHTVAQLNTAAADSSDFFDSDSLGDLGAKIPPLEYLAQGPSNLGPARKLLLKPGEVDFFDNTEDTISRAMSVLSVASPDIIILSD